MIPHFNNYLSLSLSLSLRHRGSWGGAGDGGCRGGAGGDSLPCWGTVCTPRPPRLPWPSGGPWHLLGHQYVSERERELIKCEWKYLINVCYHINITTTTTVTLIVSSDHQVRSLTWREQCRYFFQPDLLPTTSQVCVCVCVCWEVTSRYLIEILT